MYLLSELMLCKTRTMSQLASVITTTHLEKGNLNSGM